MFENDKLIFAPQRYKSWILGEQFRYIKNHAVRRFLCLGSGTSTMKCCFPLCPFRISVLESIFPFRFNFLTRYFGLYARGFVFANYALNLFIRLDCECSDIAVLNFSGSLLKNLCSLSRMFLTHVPHTRPECSSHFEPQIRHAIECKTIRLSTCASCNSVHEFLEIFYELSYKLFSSGMKFHILKLVLTRFWRVMHLVLDKHGSEEKQNP